MDGRLRMVLSELLSREEPTTLADLADRVRVSRRTLQEDLDRMDAWLAKVPGACLHRQPRRGIWLEAEPQARTLLAAEAGGASRGDMVTLSPVERQRRLIGLLLTEGRPTTLQAMADRLFFSRATIQKDVEGVARWLAARGLILHRRPRQGVELTGPESAWRRAVAEYLREIGEPQSDTRLDAGSIAELAVLFPGLKITMLEEAVRMTESSMGFRFSDEAYAGLVVHLAVTVARMQQGKEVRMTPVQMQEFAAKREYELARQMTDRLSAALGLVFPEDEIGYISLHLLGAKVQANLSRPDELQSTLSSLDRGVLALAKRIVALAEKALDLPLQEDLQLLTGLALHLRPTINRLKHGLGLRNPVLDELKRSYPSFMGVAWMAAAIIEETESVSVTEEEVGYLAMHLGAAVERSRTRRRVLVVCGSGLGTAQLVASKLRTHFPDLEIAGLVPSLAITEADLIRQGIDLIIATVPVAAGLTPVVRVHPLLREEDVQRLARFLGGAAHAAAAKATVAPDPLLTLRGLLEGRLLHVRTRAASKQGVITDLARALLDAGHVTKGFYTAVCQREATTSTAIGKGVAIPHAEAQFTREAAIALGVLPQAVDWSGEPADLIFMLALDVRRPDLVEAVTRELYQLISDDQALDRIRGTVPG
ncbi:MAG TPA: PRD domain-containing protein [Symbiobacteriaceae bacterium]|nr:PRD domain-containing protein [Symbiobacteriaceae bacterium]